MNEQETLARLKELSSKKDSIAKSARLLLSIIERCNPSMKNRLLSQFSQSLAIADEISKNANNPDFQRQLLAMRDKHHG